MGWDIFEKICQRTGGKTRQKYVEVFILGLKRRSYRIGISVVGKRIRAQLKQTDGSARCMHAAASTDDRLRRK